MKNWLETIDLPLKRPAEQRSAYKKPVAKTAITLSLFVTFICNFQIKNAATRTIQRSKAALRAEYAPEPSKTSL